ncbi:hypothetical protein M885DRAFT_540948 [Pelagophyceae sp. CCMP2097]|nr:hypothetical protein M885DRAFT_540948 [Pelagophyceae sp. CCMP2097]
MGAGVSAAQADEVTLRVSRAEAVAVLALLGEPRLREELAQLGKDRSGDALDLAQRLLATKELNVDEDDDDAIAQQLASTERLLTLDQASATAQSPGKRVTIDPAPSPVSAGPPSPSHFDAAAVGEAANMHGGDGEAVESLTTEQKADFEKYGVLEAKVDSYWTLADKVEILAEFKALDLDNDGLVTVTEYRTHLRSKGGVERDEAEVDAIIQRMKQYIREDPDADGDGFIAFNEFISIWGQDDGF